jgi:hypothetical protein
MRKQDIVTGELYAWQESRRSRVPRPIRFLASPAADPLWERRWGDVPGGTLYRRAAPGSTRPYASHSRSGTDTGYPAVMARWNTDVRIAEALELMHDATLDQFGRVTDPLDRQLEWRLVTDLRYVTGLWEPVRAAWQAELDKADATARARADEQDSRKAARRELQERLRAVGVQTSESAGQSTGFDMLLLSRFELEKLAERLEQERPAEPATVLATPGELMAVATGQMLPMRLADDTGRVVELRIPTVAEYREIMRAARERLTESGMKLPVRPERSDADIEALLRPLRAERG